MGRYEQHHVRTSRCPCCGYLMNAASSVDDNTHAPVPGDYSVCLQCGAFLRFGSRLRLGRISKLEMEQMDADTLMELSRVQRAISTMRKLDNILENFGKKGPP